jgi:hypothetical protein
MPPVDRGALARAAVKPSPLNGFGQAAVLNDITKAKEISMRPLLKAKPSLRIRVSEHVIARLALFKKLMSFT